MSKNMNRSQVILEDLVRAYGEKDAYIYTRVEHDWTSPDRERSHADIIAEGWTDKEMKTLRYGHGLYFTFELPPQYTYPWSDYGKYIIRSTVDLDEFVIFDYDLAQKVHGNQYKIVDQLKKLNVDTGMMFDLHSIDNALKANVFPPTSAMRVYRQSRVVGIVVPEKDYHIVVCSESSKRYVQPVAFALAGPAHVTPTWYAKDQLSYAGGRE